MKTLLVSLVLVFGLSVPLGADEAVSVNHPISTFAENAVEATTTVAPLEAAEVWDSKGTAFFFTSDGWMLSAEHIYPDGHQLKDIQIFFDSTHIGIAEIVYRDKVNDVAVLRLCDHTNLAFLPLGGTDVLKFGDEVMAVGDPLLLWDSVSFGRVSYPARPFSTEVPDKTYIQFDAGINPGNSGGPLIDGRGFVVGIVVMIAANSNDIAFAVPMSRVLPAVQKAMGMTTCQSTN